MTSNLTTMASVEAATNVTRNATTEYMFDPDDNKSDGVLVITVDAAASGAGEVGPLAEDYKWWNWSGSQAIPDNNTSWTVGYNCNPPTGVPSGAYVTRVRVHHEITHTYIGDLECKVYNATHEWMVRDNEGGSADNVNETRENTTLFDGDNPVQSWYYRVRDIASGDTGTLTVMQLYVYYDTPPSQPDLTKQTDNISQTSGYPGDTLNCTLTVTNQGTGACGASSYVYYYWKKDSAVYSDTYKVGQDSVANLSAGGKESESFSFTIPAGTTPGTYKLYYWIDATGAVSESNEGNNKWEWTVTVNQPTRILSVGYNPADGTSGTVGQAKTVTVSVGAEVAQAGVLQVWMYDADFSTQDKKWVYISSPQSTVRNFDLSLVESVAGARDYSTYVQFRPGITTGPINDSGLYDVIWSGSGYTINWTVPVCTVQLTIRDTNGQGLQYATGEYWADGGLKWSKGASSSGYMSDANSSVGSVCYLRAKTICSRADVRDDNSPGSAIQADTAIFLTTAGNTYSRTIDLNNNVGVNTSEGGIAFREIMRAWNYVDSQFGYDRSIVTGYVDATDTSGAYCDGNSLHYGHGQAVLRNGVPSAAGHIDDTILHEYGHAVQYSGYGSSWGQPSGCTCQNHGWIYGHDNDCGHDALVEGWAEYFPVMLYNHYNAADTHFGASDGTYEVNLENAAGMPGVWRATPDERNEFTFAMALWDIYDSNNEAGDTLSLGDDEIWTVMRNDNPRTVEEFFQKFNDRYPQYAAALEQIYILNGMHPNWLTLSTGSLDFGTSSSSHTFTIRRAGWYGNVATSWNQPDWNISKDVAWISSISPASGTTETETDTITVTINRSALAGGVNTGHLTITPGHYGRAQVITVTVLNDNNPPVISVTPAIQDFGSIQVGTTADRTFSVQNTGGGTLLGSATVSAPFAVVSGGTYNLGAGVSQTVTVRYSPTVAGSDNQNVSFTGDGGTSRPVSGNAYDVPPMPSFEQWQLQYFNCTSCPQAAATADPDGDGMSNTNEFLAGTVPTNSASVFRVIAMEKIGADVRVSFTSVSGKYYCLERCDSIGGAWTTVADNIPGTGEIRQALDINGANRSSGFYRVRLNQSPNLVLVDTDGDGIPDAWMQLYFGHPTGQDGDSSRASDDRDGDGMSNLREYLTGTNPTNSASTFRILSLARESNDIRVTWATVGGHTNIVQAASSLSSAYSNISLNIVIPGGGDTATNYLDVGGATNWPSRFYRVGLVP